MTLGKGRIISLQFSRYLRGTYEYSFDFHKEYFNLDPNKKTILYAPTQGKFSTFSKQTYNIFLKLRDRYNVIIKPHAPCWYLNPELIKECEFKLNRQLHNILPFIEMADVFVGDVSASTSAAFYYPEKPVILITNTNLTINKNLMGDHTCNIVSVDKIPEEVEKCLLNPEQKKDARKEYFNFWYGTINGTEGYKYSQYVLSEMRR